METNNVTITRAEYDELTDNITKKHEQEVKMLNNRFDLACRLLCLKLQTLIPFLEDDYDYKKLANNAFAEYNESLARTKAECAEEIHKVRNTFYARNEIKEDLLKKEK